ncbi:lysosome-associated membrane glycoprotein 1-like [Branchiostoma floridae]|uniref:Lysosome-associated membrane glycoprotein 1-like n=1 Tax=Branchiostoma floridae TaxID=7739 RepID=A0A9J7MIX5_BRAFL|nr:lysosome-associated membrane glycoprotein 1-like [Branchiostoma floridae]
MASSLTFPNRLYNIIFIVILCVGAKAVSVDSSQTTGHFSLQENGRPCFLLDLSATCHVQYEKTDGTVATVSYPVPTYSQVSGFCATNDEFDTLSSIQLNFGDRVPGHGFNGTFALILKYQRDVPVMTHFWLNEVVSVYTLSPGLFPDAKFPNVPVHTYNIGTYLNTSAFLSPRSYLCRRDKEFSLDQYVEERPTNVTIHYIHVQPFLVQHGGKFSQTEECPQDFQSTTEPPYPVTTDTLVIPVGHFVLHDDKGQICLLANFGAMFRVEYELIQGMTRNATYVLPENCAISGSCEEGTVHVTFSFDTAFNLSASFSSNEKTFKLVSLSVGYIRSADNFPHALYPDTSDIEELTNLTLLETDAGKSYLCKEPGVIKVGPHVTLEVLELQIQPFDVKNGTFGETNECNKDHSSTIAPFPTIVPASSNIPTNHTHTTTNMPTLPPPVGPTEPVQGNYTVHDSEGKVCLLADMGLQLRINYTKQNGQIATGVVNVPVNSEVSGKCSESHSSLTLTFYDATFNLTISFAMHKKDGDPDTYQWTGLYLSYVEAPSIFPGTQHPNEPRLILNTSLNLFTTGAGKSYKCNADVDMTVTKDMAILVRRAHLQAFGVTSGQFSAPDECAEDSNGSVDKTAIIVVGFVLLVIALCIAVAGVVGKRKEHMVYVRLPSLLD